ncbi:MAG: sensor histidine kinase [Myxococcales bacterium]|nr:MAG: sensor histidine kinase [Myxococcales bacterium]
MSRRRTVAGRILAAYALVLVAFSVTLTWSAYAQRRAAQQALLLRTGYMPLLLSLSTALETQNLVSAQLNHITDARNPEDARRWIETQRRLRPVAFVGVRSAIDRGLVRGRDTRAQQLGNDILVEVVAVESFLGTDGTRLAALFGALERGNELAAAEERERLIEHEIEGARRLRELSRRVERAMDDLSTEAASREHRAVELLVLLGAISLAVGVGTALYVRRVLGPLGRVTERARAVAQGDLTPRPLQSPPRDEIGELAGTFESMVEAIGRARGELVAAERMAAVGRMAAHVTHEIRNPISALGLNGELLEEELMPLDGADEARVLLRAMRSEIDRLAALSEHYLSLARRPTRQLEEGDVGDLVGSLLTFVRPELERARVQSRLDVAPGLPEVRLDEAQLRQALLNLIRNAREAMPSGGQLALSAHPVDGGVELCVDDTGEGIPDSLRASLFDPFFTTKKQGTGLGLAVTREIVDAHGGRIACEARPGGGTRFRLWLPEAAAGGDDGAGAAAQA